MTVLHVKQMLYYRTGAFSGLDLYISYDWGVIVLNTHGSLRSRRHFVRVTYKPSYTSVLHTKRLGYYSRRCFSTLEMDASFDWRATTPNVHRDRFLVGLFRITFNL